MAKKDPVIRAAEKAYRKSRMAQYDRLRAAESKWKRKVTIATNKLESIRRQMNDFAYECTCEIEGIDPETGKAGVPEKGSE